MCSDCYLEVDNRKICHLCIEKDGWKSFLRTYVGLTDEQKRLEWERWPETQRTFLQENYGIPEPQPPTTTPRPSLYHPEPPAPPSSMPEEVGPPDLQGSDARGWTERLRSFPMGFQGFIGAIVAIVILGTFSIAILSRDGDSSSDELANDQGLAVSPLEEEDRGLGLVYTRNGVNLRAGPGTDHAVTERTTSQQQPLEYAAKEGEWYQLQATDQMPARYVHESVVIRVIDYPDGESPRPQRAAEPDDSQPSASSSVADSSFSSELSVEALGSAAFAVSKSFVRKALNNPESADFPLSTFESYYLGNGKFRVSSYVNSRNFLGMTDRINYVAILTFIGDTDFLLESHGWKLDRLILDGDVVTDL